MEHRRQPTAGGYFQGRGTGHSAYYHRGGLAGYPLSAPVQAGAKMAGSLERHQPGAEEKGHRGHRPTAHGRSVATTNRAKDSSQRPEQNDWQEFKPLFGGGKIKLCDTLRAVTPFGGLSVLIEFFSRIGLV